MVLDLFSGCGGLSLGFKIAGFSIAGHVEKDAQAYKTANLNIKPELEFDGNLDITNIDADHPLLAELQGEIDVVIGGPPCQAYSIVGRGKMASLEGNKDAHLADHRGELYLDFLRLIETLKPKALLMENVPSILSYGKSLIPEKICEELTEIGYSCSYTILNAAAYGVPQYRERLFILGICSQQNVSPEFPIPTHTVEAEKDLGRARMRNLIDDRNVQFGVIPPANRDPSIPEAVTAGEALDDLPFISTMNDKTWLYDLDQPLPYKANAKNSYSSMMRNWPGFSSNGKVTCNTCRETRRDFPIFRMMEEGDKYPDALKYAELLFEDKIETFTDKNNRRPTDEEYSQIKKETVPPYDPDKFVDKWRKLDREKPSHTVVAHLSVDTYSHIHYDSEQARAISVREAARLQSFPDGFQFIGSLASVFRQIGNAVPPLLAFKIAKAVKGSLS